MSGAVFRIAVLGAAALLAACQATPEQSGEEKASTTEASEAPAEDAAAEAEGEATADATTEEPEQPATESGATPASGPHIYMALQPGGTGHPTSVVFAIDSARDGTPSDDPAIRLTPDAGNCNPQEMRSYDFPPGASTPVVGQPELERGLTARDLPRFLAASVTGRLIDAGLASEPEETRPLNVCTRKLWERLVTAQGQAAQGGG